MVPVDPLGSVAQPVGCAGEDYIPNGHNQKKQEQIGPERQHLDLLQPTRHEPDFPDGT